MLRLRSVSTTRGMRWARGQMQWRDVSGGGRRLVARARHQPRDFRGGNRRAEQIALHLRAAELAQELALPFLLDAFGGRRHVAGFRNVDHGLDDRGRSVPVADVLDEGAVDLDLVEGEAVQVA